MVFFLQSLHTSSPFCTQMLCKEVRSCSSSAQSCPKITCPTQGKSQSLHFGVAQKALWDLAPACPHQLPPASASGLQLFPNTPSGSTSGLCLCCSSAWSTLPLTLTCLVRPSFPGHPLDPLPPFIFPQSIRHQLTNTVAYIWVLGSVSWTRA